MLAAPQHILPMDMDECKYLRNTINVTAERSKLWNSFDIHSQMMMNGMWHFIIIIRLRPIHPHMFEQPKKSRIRRRSYLWSSVLRATRVNSARKSNMNRPKVEPFIISNQFSDGNFKLRTAQIDQAAPSNKIIHVNSGANA